MAAVKTAMISCSLATTRVDLGDMLIGHPLDVCLGRAFWSSSDACLSLTSFLTASLASRRRLRTAILADWRLRPDVRQLGRFLAALFAHRRHKYRIRSPMEAGFNPRSLADGFFNLGTHALSRAGTLMVRNQAEQRWPSATVRRPWSRSTPRAPCVQQDRLAMARWICRLFLNATMDWSILVLYVCLDVGRSCSSLGHPGSTGHLIAVKCKPGFFVLAHDHALGAHRAWKMENTLQAASGHGTGQMPWHP